MAGMKSYGRGENLDISDYIDVVQRILRKSQKRLVRRLPESTLKSVVFDIVVVMLGIRSVHLLPMYSTEAYMFTRILNMKNGMPYRLVLIR